LEHSAMTVALVVIVPVACFVLLFGLVAAIDRE
jgi:hypothetical protein